MRAFAALAVATLLALTQAADPKANEFTSTDCSGSISFPHHSTSLTDVTMDDTSHSVFLAGGQWAGFSQKGSTGCSGQLLGTMQGACNNLDTGIPGGVRVQCVRFNPFSSD